MRPETKPSRGNKPSNTGTGAYTKARQRLTEESIKTLLRTSGDNLDNASPESYLWHQRRVLITDGSTLLMPDTEQNQNEYPQPGTQKKGLVSLFSESLSWCVLAVVRCWIFAVAPYEGKETGEQALLRRLLFSFACWRHSIGRCELWELFPVGSGAPGRGADVVFEKNGSRIIDFRKCYQTLGSKDGLFKLKRPAKKEWMSQELYDQLPEKLVVRAVKNKKTYNYHHLTGCWRIFPYRDYWAVPEALAHWNRLWRDQNHHEDGHAPL